MDWSVAVRPLAGQSVCGDLHLVKLLDHGLLIAVVDGAGHGQEAAVAAQAAVAVLEQHATESVISLVNRCHQALTNTRGVVMTLASVDARDNSIAWIGVGNVAGRLFRAGPHASHTSECVLLRAGVVGYQLPALHASVLPIARGDVLVFATDGIRDDFGREVHMKESLQQLAERILRQYGKDNDDALVLTVRYLGPREEPPPRETWS
jgi:serine phosphatase RsbU (regulator of sigma subunit)